MTACNVVYNFSSLYALSWCLIYAYFSFSLVETTGAASDSSTGKSVFVLHVLPAMTVFHLCLVSRGHGGQNAKQLLGKATFLLVKFIATIENLLISYTFLENIVSGKDQCKL